MSYLPIDLHHGHDGTDVGAYLDNRILSDHHAISGTPIAGSAPTSSRISDSQEMSRDHAISPIILNPISHGDAIVVGDQRSSSSRTSNEKNLKKPAVHQVSLDDDETRLLSSGSSKYLDGGSWTVEIFCFVIAVSALAAVIGVLAHYNGKSMPDWPTGMTLNTLIAILTAIANAVLATPLQQGLSQLKWINFKRESRPLTDMDAFDDASRGFWGSIRLLVMGRGG